MGDLEKAPPVLKIRPTHYPNRGSGIYTTRGRGMWVNADVPFLIGEAYGADFFRMILPDGLTNGGFDYLNTLDSNDRKIALQAEIKQRFGLTAHRETRETDLLLLKISDPEKLRLHLTKGGAFANYGTGEGNVQKRIYKNVALSAMCNGPEGYFRKPVIDRTGNSKHYDFNIQWTERKWASPNERMAAVQSALSDQLNQFGLELVPSREPVEMLVVEKVR
jgi:uncharacterized protein (TIGR03435 family)